MPHQSFFFFFPVVPLAECRAEIEIAAGGQEQRVSFPEAAERQLNGFCKPYEQQIGALLFHAARKGELPSGNCFFWILMQY